jgi:beta-1,4-mannosyltransferase
MLPTRYIKNSPPKATKSGSTIEPKISVQVLVLGDIGRSPRMQYHAMSIAKHGGRVDIIGYNGSSPATFMIYRLMVSLESTLNPGLVGNPLITIVPLPLPPPLLRSKTLPFILAGPLKVLWQIWGLFYALSYVVKPARWLLVQVGRVNFLIPSSSNKFTESAFYTHSLRCLSRMLFAEYTSHH